MQAQMIYPQSNVAAMIAARMTKSKGFEYAVTKVLTGFQVAPKSNTPLLDALKKAKNEGVKVTPMMKEFPDIFAPWKKPPMLDAVEAAWATPTQFEHLNNKVQYVPLATAGMPGEMEFKLTYHSDSPKYVGAWFNGKPIYFGKTTLIAWERDFATNMVLLKMTQATAKKRGLVS